MLEGIFIAIGVIVLGVPFLLVWWKLADRWADEEHKRFRGARKPEGPAPTVVSRSSVERDG